MTPTGDVTRSPAGSSVSTSAARTPEAALDLAVGGVRPDMVAAMSALGGWTVKDLDPLIASGVLAVDERGVLGFASDAVRDTVLTAASPSAVAMAHGRAARACADLHLPVRLRVHHLRQSVLFADEAVARQLEDAARTAEADDDCRTASDAWHAAARLSPSPTERVARAASALRVVVLNGLDYAGEGELLDLLAGEQLSSDCACWVDWIKALQRSDADPTSAMTAQWSTIRRARDAAPATLRAILWDAALNAWTLGDTAAGLRAAREFVALQQAEGPRGDEVEPWWTGTALLAAGMFEVGEVAESARLRSIAIEAARGVDPYETSFHRLLSVVFLDDLLLDMSAQAAERVAICRQRAAGEPATVACLLGIEAWRARATGDWSRADEHLAEGRPLAAAAGAAGAQRGMSALTVELAALRGQDDLLQREARTLRDQVNRTGDRRRQTTLDRALGLRHLSAGRLDEAVATLTAVAELPFLARGLRDGVVGAKVDLLEAVIRRGGGTIASARSDEVRSLLAAMDQPLARALERRVAGLVGTGEEAITAYGEAVALHRQAGDPFELARTLLLLGEEERRARRRGDARLHLLEAQSLFESLAAAPWLARTQNELRAAGGHVTERSDTGLLTPQELAVARAAASGLSTREVAEVMFLSPRTVEFHLSNVYRKLGIRGRAALAARIGGLAN